MRIYMTGSYCDKELFRELYTTQKNPPSFAQQNLERLLFTGFEQNGCDVDVVSMIPARSFPGNRKVLWRSRRTKEEKITLNALGMINILVIKQICVSIGVTINFAKWLIKNRNERDKRYFSYSVNPPLTAPCLLLSKMTGCKTAVYVSELPQHRIYHNQGNIVRRVLLKLHTAVSRSLHDMFDSYVLVTGHMDNVVNRKHKPSLVVEGMVDGSAEKPTEIKRNEKFTILYAGGMNKRNGVELLTEAFMQVEGDMELWMFGSGDYDSKLKLLAANDGRIKVFGNQANDVVVNAQRQAHLLVNPRPAWHEFTEFSFPSKTIEYMISGTPLLTTRLKGIPDEYFEYCYTIDEDGIEGVKSSLIHCIKDPYLLSTGIKAASFVVANKSCKQQTKKILDII